ncbi:SDR family NAD(P)-dependent oxidoreductase [Actinoplanes sp. NEAU-A12]|uniref:SDR family NAD(P)-dependent oxidoreductase n=1 Tax=Actinoplanes sandaracinus TaxID=3045177 RepID=A0ABT6X1V5_9ACTN|nr:SDR family NAD(P)-dependent oxidoreductase [Actinoplanes sandaracinus]MDI6105963.1 SDR family NAD(P)-dependent oxidoreductase [Actinoplanes sandaracinus]
MLTKPLTGTVALVAGATRGAGRGIAVELGAAGAQVYGTGRSTRPERSDMNRPETIEETADLVTAAGGHGIAARCDHTDAQQVAALMKQIEDQHGKLDLLVNDIWGGDSLTEWGSPFWRLDLTAIRAMWETAVNRLALAQAEELREHGITARRTGEVLTSWDLAEHYGLHDVDGRQPNWARHIGSTLPV